MTLLHISASSRGQRSESRALAASLGATAWLCAWLWP